jgi:hypothetical protein
MTRTGQKKFVRGLSNSIAKHICALIDAGKIPESWDGHELRVLLGYEHDKSAKVTLVAREPRSKRARDFRNTIIVNNL